MKKMLNITGLLFCMLLTIKALSQNVVMDYQAWNPSNPPCNLFASATNVPATIDGSASTIEHQTKIGQPKYNTSGKYVELTCSYGSVTSILGTRYRIAYNFKAGYSYAIYVTAEADANTVGTSYGPWLRVDIDNNGGGGNIACGGPQSIVQNLTGNPSPIQLSTTTFAEYQFLPPILSSTSSTLEISAIPATNGGTKTIRIQKIRIVGTAPTPTFTLPPTVSVVCGATSPITFTVTNVYNSPGVTAYDWNLGSSNNGWLYNGNPAPQTISTGTANTLTLTPVCGASQNNISATVTADGNNYATNAANINKSLPSITISGPQTLCNGSAVYTLNNLPCNATVSNWIASPTGIVTVTPNDNSATVVKTGSGNQEITLTATVNSCGISANPSVGITAGAPEPAYGIYPVDAGTNYCSGSGYSYGFETLGGTGDPLRYEWIVYGPTQTTNYYNQGDQIQLSFTESGTNTIAVIANNTCGGAAAVTTTIDVSSCSGWGFKASPNPTNSSIEVTLDEQAVKSVKIITIREIQITDKMGNIVKQFRYGPGTKRAVMNISQLKPDIYYIRLFNGREWKAKSIIKQ